MKSKEENTPDSKDDKKLPGYPTYPAEEDIYSQFSKEGNLDPEDPSKEKSLNEKPRTANEKDFSDTMIGNDLDVPGADQDDAMEDIGSEDEENNYYSLGGDDHNDLDEDNVT